MPGNYRFISAEQKWLVLTISLHGMMIRDIVSATDEVEDGGAIRMDSRGLVSPAACLFPKAFVCTKRGGVEKFSGGA